MTDAQQKALREVMDTAIDRRHANEAYQDAIKRAAALGVSNIKIALSAGVSETAIRLYRKRNGL